MLRALLGERARHVPAWLYVQDQGAGLVAFVGASRNPLAAAAHPLRYGSERTHQLIVGELVVRPHRVIATDLLRGHGLASLVGQPYDVGDLLTMGEEVV
jgi:hypothetical protein